MSWRKPERKDYGGDFLASGGAGGEIPVSQYHVLDVRDKGCLKTWKLRSEMDWKKGHVIQVGDKIEGHNVLVGGDKRMKGLVTMAGMTQGKFIVTFRVVFQDYKE